MEPKKSLVYSFMCGLQANEDEAIQRPRGAGHFSSDELSGKAAILSLATQNPIIISATLGFGSFGRLHGCVVRNHLGLASRRIQLFHDLVAIVESHQNSTQSTCCPRQWRSANQRSDSDNRVVFCLCEKKRAQSRSLCGQLGSLTKLDVVLRLLWHALHSANGVHKKKVYFFVEARGGVSIILPP